MGQINGVQAGASGVFVATPTPAGGALQTNAVPTWATDHPDVTSLTVSPDGLTCTAAVAATGSGSFVLTISGIASDGTKISGSATVPILPSTPPPPTPATGFDISQTS